jgi:hypothetical protein
VHCSRTKGALLLGERAHLVQRKRAHFKELQALVSWQIGQLTRAKLACYLCCNFFPSSSIINFLFTGFPLGGFSRVMLTKNYMC